MHLGNATPGQGKELSHTKPFVSPFLYAALGTWAGVYISYAQAEYLDLTVCLISGSVSAFASLFTLAALLASRRFKILFLILGLGVGCCVGLEAAAQTHHQTQRLSVEPEEYRFEIVESPRDTDFGKTAVAYAKTLSGERIKVKVFFNGNESEYEYGDLLVSNVSLKPLSESNREFYWQEGIVATVSVTDSTAIERNDPFGHLLRFRAYALSQFDGFEGDGVGFLRAILFGDRQLLSQTSLYQEVKVIGLAHMVAVSGAHLVIVTGLLTVLLSVLGIPKRLIIVLQVGFIVCYVVCAGVPISAIRAAVWHCSRYFPSMPADHPSVSRHFHFV